MRFVYKKKIFFAQKIYKKNLCQHDYKMLNNNSQQPNTTIKKILVANRGEIAIRIFRAATELNIKTVAMYTYEDRYSLHVYKADEAYQIGKNNEPLKPYLNIEEIIQIAKEAEADAIHPGYGFLSENVQFATRCAQENIIFIGPKPEVMQQLGDKINAKQIAKAANVPIIESNQQTLLTLDTALAEAQRIGYPLIIKAAAGGGGRGMRVVRNAADLQRTFNEAQSEALNAFGDATIFLEKYIENPKHIEVQILGDNEGNIVHLFERDCSVQRRFQKVVEIAPAPTLRPQTRKKLYDYALAIAQHVQYNNAGTVEFLVDAQQNIFFIEVNPRIQVEHTVTEQVTGIDIVRTQILIASGHSLKSSGIFINSQKDVQCNGYAIQCRITTENPKNNFKPDYGTLIAYRNAAGFDIRLDEGSAYAGATISPFFDSLLVKVTASGRTLKGACQRLHRALIEFRIRGVATNIPFLENVILHPQFQEGSATVNFIDQHPELLASPSKLDRATRIMRFLAETTINGNPDIKVIDNSKNFDKQPIIPDFDKTKPVPLGSKNFLETHGRTALMEWLKTVNTVQITDTTLRDAHQSLLATRMRTYDMVQVAQSFAHHHPQTFSMEVWGGATFDVALRFLHECPWKRLQELRKAVPNVLLQMLLRGANAVGYSAYPDNLVEHFIEKSNENGVDIFRIFDSLNWVENLKTAIKAVNQRTKNGIAEACICYTGDVLQPKNQKYTLQYYTDLAKQLEDAGAHILAIKDMAGLLKPYSAEALIYALQKATTLPIHLHTHDAAGAQLATYLKAVEAGVHIVDVALASMSGLGSQPNFNTFVEIMKTQPRAPHFDTQSLNSFSDYWETVRPYYYPFEAGTKAHSAEVYTHEIPGGQYSNLLAQANSLGVGNQMKAVVKAYIAVNELFGDIVKVTPSSKVVGDLAIYMVVNNLSKNDILEKGNTIDFPQSVKGFFKGELGQPYGGFPKDLQKMILKNEKPLTERPNATLQPVNIEAELQLFYQKFGNNFNELDFLSYKMYPKVFEDYTQNIEKYGDLSVVPTPFFFYGLKEGEEVSIQIGKGKVLLIKLMYISKPDEDGFCQVYFKLNGQTRTIKIKDNNAQIKKQSNLKANRNNVLEIGAPLQGLLSKIFVQPQQTVQAGQPLFIIEAMKMETTVTANTAATITQIVLPEGARLEADDLVIVLK